MYLYSNEIVFRGHPDKVCDQISDALLDAYLAEDTYSRCGIEVVGGKGQIFITGEVTSNALINVEDITKRVLTDIGYSTDYNIINNLGVQSLDIALGTNEEVGGAGDNGMMFGYATNETPEMLPKAMVILQKFAQAYDELRKINNDFLPDGKAQITGVYNDDGHLTHILTATICYQNTENNRQETDKIIINIFNSIANLYQVGVEEYLINPTGKFLIGGFDGDAGLTGRKIVVDNYQSFANVGGGAFSGKDPTKVDRSAAYWAREIAKKVLKDQNLKWCEIQLSYAIGKSIPLAICAKTNIGQIQLNEKLYEESTPQNIIKELKLREIKYEPKARFGHFLD